MAAFRSREVVQALRVGDVRALVSRHSDLALAAVVVSIVAMMIIPLPTLLLDLLISLNIAVAVTLLLISIYVTDALRIATFPTLLLLTTLFRLALEVSATRLILSRGNAGQVIHAFGNFAVAGNLVVGAVIFLVLTIIQFVVISKGSERVAEVAARFALDAMPGKQMAIDAELRGGHIDLDEARRRRALLTRESQLFGSMDGAMKFVKGDAIAGLVVLAVNIAGGLIIGIFQRGMTWGAAARLYTMLTIGEGLVTQIPALLISTGAGIIVTRVASEDEGAHLGRDVAAQILGHPKAIAIAAGLLGLLALVPGLPTTPFLILAVLLGFVAFRLLKLPANDGALPAHAAAPVARRGNTAAKAGDGYRAGGADLPAPVLTPIALSLGEALSARLCPTRDPSQLAQRLAGMVRDRLFTQLGLPLPALVVRLSAAGLPDHGYVFALKEIPLGRGDTSPREDRSPAGTRDIERLLADDLMALLRRYGADFIGIEETENLLDSLARTHPALVREVVPKVISPALLTDVLRRLVEEGISLRNLKDILGALAECPVVDRDAVSLTERVRTALRRPITYQHADASGVLEAYLLDPVIEDAIRQSIHHSAGGSYLALEPRLSRDIVDAVGRALAINRNTRPVPVILTTPEIRRHVRGLVETEHPHIAVLAYPELAPEAKIQSLGHIQPGAQT